MKKVYMECTLKIMPRAEVEMILNQKVIMKELPKGRYLLFVTNPI